MPRIKTETALTTTNANQPATVPKDLDIYRQAIEAGRQTLVDERSKAAAARAIFKILSDHHLLVSQPLENCRSRQTYS